MSINGFGAVIGAIIGAGFVFAGGVLLPVWQLISERTGKSGTMS